jgi:hypothetical protein
MRRVLLREWLNCEGLNYILLLWGMMQKEVKKLHKDDFDIDSWQYQLLERYEDNNLSTFTTVELRELLRFVAATGLFSGHMRMSMGRQGMTSLK